jgi:group I intron endonuclease
MSLLSLTEAKKLDGGEIGVYCIYLSCYPSAAYIGSSKDIRKRLMSHLSSLRRGTHKNYKLRGLYKRHGEHHFKYRILESHSTEEQARSREQLLIDFIPPNRLYNIDKHVYSYK